MMGRAVVFDHGAVAVNGMVFVRRVDRRGFKRLEQARQHHGLVQFAGGRQNYHLFAYFRGVPADVTACALGQPRQPAGQNVASLHAHFGIDIIGLRDGAKADQIAKTAVQFGDFKITHQIFQLCRLG